MSNYERSLTVGETREVVAKAINAFDPRKVKTITDAIAMISLADGVNNRFNLAKYRTIANVHATGLWRQDAKTNGKQFATFHEWAKYRFSMEKANAYNAVKVGQLIREDGAGSIYDTADAYFSFSQLLEICNAKKLYTNPKTREEFKQVNAIRHAMTEEGNFRSETTFENGKPITRILFEIASDDGDKMTIIEALIECSVVRPYMSVKEIHKALSKDYYFDRYGAHEDKELPDTDNETPDTDNETPDTDNETPDTDNETPDTDNAYPELGTYITVEERQSLRTMAEGMLLALKSDNTEDFVSLASDFANAVLDVIK